MSGLGHKQVFKNIDKFSKEIINVDFITKIVSFMRQIDSESHFSLRENFEKGIHRDHWFFSINRWVFICLKIGIHFVKRKLLGHQMKGQERN